jgi:beta-lactamase regulating signal transducer with metallopeptidase domain
MAAWSASEQPVEMRFLVWIALFWGIGILFFLVKLVTEVMHSWLLKRHSTEIRNAEWQITLTRLKKNIGVSRDVAIRLSQKLSIPCVVGYFKPVILLPSSVFLGLSPLQIEMIVLHELAHIRRNDVLINYVQIVLKIVFFLIQHCFIFHAASIWSVSMLAMIWRFRLAAIHFYMRGPCKCARK